MKNAKMSAPCRIIFRVLTGSNKIINVVLIGSDRVEEEGVSYYAWKHSPTRASMENRQTTCFVRGSFSCMGISYGGKMTI